MQQPFFKTYNFLRLLPVFKLRDCQNEKKKLCDDLLKTPEEAGQNSSAQSRNEIRRKPSGRQQRRMLINTIVFAT